MSLKDKFRQYVEREDRKLLNLEESFRGRHRNRKYHSFFEGYTEYTELDKNGKEKIRRVYTADYYRQSGSLWQTVLTRCAYVLMFVLAVYCVLSASMDRSAACNYTWYVQIWHACCLAILFWVFTLLFSYVTSGRNWTIYDYKQCHKKLLTVSKFAVVLHTLGALSSLVYMGIFQSRESLNPAIRLLVAGLMMLLINRIEHSLTYETMKNTAQNYYAGGVEIK